MRLEEVLEKSRELRGDWALSPDVVFLNHGSFGARLRPVIEAQKALTDEAESNPVHFVTARLPELLFAARAALSEFVGADPASLVFVANATTGVNVALRSLNLTAGAEVLYTNHEYLACKNALHAICAEVGATPVMASVPFPISAESEVLEALERGVTSRTRAVLIDHVTSQTGLIFPVLDVIRWARSRGLRVVVDGAHAPGMLPLNLEELGADFYVGNCHKWMCAPQGTAFLSVAREFRAGVRPPIFSNFSVEGADRFHSEFDWIGTQNYTAWAMLPEVIRAMGLQHPQKWPGIYKQNQALARMTDKVIGESLGVGASAPSSMIGSLVSFELPDGKPHEGFMDPLCADLLAAGIEAPVFAWPAPPKRLLRVSAQLYNHEAEYRYLAHVLQKLL